MRCEGPRCLSSLASAAALTFCTFLGLSMDRWLAVWRASALSRPFCLCATKTKREKLGLGEKPSCLSLTALLP